MPTRQDGDDQTFEQVLLTHDDRFKLLFEFEQTFIVGHSSGIRFLERSMIITAQALKQNTWPAENGCKICGCCPDSPAGYNPSPYFSPEGGFIATDFESTGVFLDERNTDCISEFRKTSVDSKGKRETVILVRNTGWKNQLNHESPYKLLMHLANSKTCLSPIR